MPKARKSANGLHKLWLEKIKNPAHFTIDGKLIYCQPCSKSYDWHLFSQLNAHINSALHCRNATRHEKKPELQALINDPPVDKSNPFAVDLCEALLAADIPWAKLKNKVFKTFIEKYTNTSVPDESSLRKHYLRKIYTRTLDQIRDEMKNCGIYVSIDETTDACGRYMANVLVGALKKENPSPGFLLTVKQLEKTNNSTITQLVLDIFPLLWPGVEQHEINKRFWLLLTDGVPYMVKAGKNLKSTYPNLIHVTCIAHALNLVAEKVRESFGKVDKMIGAIKAVFRKLPARIVKYKEMFPALALPPSPVLTRWGTWLEAVEFYSENYEDVKVVIDTFNEAESKCIATAQELLADSSLCNNLAFISGNFCFLRNSIDELQEEGLSLSRSLQILENAKLKLGEVSGEIGELVFRKFNSVIEKNVGLQEMQKVGKILEGLDETTNLSPSVISNMKFAPLTTVEVERSFSIEKAILSDRRRSFKTENIELVLVSHHFLMKS